MRAQRRLADLACAGTAFAYHLGTTGADSGTLIANRIFTKAAAVRALAVHDVAALITGNAVPVRQRNIRAVGVVGGENAADQAEKIAQPAFLQRGSYGCCTVTFADDFITDMGMRYGVVCSGWMWIDGHHKVRHLVIQFLQSVQVQSNSKPPEVDIVKRNGLGDGTQGLFFAVEFHVTELISQRLDLISDSGQFRHLLVSTVQEFLGLADRIRNLV